jgi:hypothetical protein
MLRKTSKIIAESVQLPEHTKKIARKLDYPLHNRFRYHSKE